MVGTIIATTRSASLASWIVMAIESMDVNKLYQTTTAEFASTSATQLGTERNVCWSKMKSKGNTTIAAVFKPWIALRNSSAVAAAALLKMRMVTAAIAKQTAGNR